MTGERDPRKTDEFDALLEMVELKDETRTGWELRGVEAPESVAAHTWSVATLCLLVAPLKPSRDD